MNLLNRGSNAPETRSLPVLKIKTTRGAVVVLQMDAPVWFGTHYLDKQYLCSGADCPACIDRALRIKGYMPILGGDPENLRPGMLEFSTSTWDRLLGRGNALEILIGRGTTVEATRRKAKSPLALEPLPNRGQLDFTLESQEHLVSCIAVLHRLRPLRDGESAVEWEATTRDARRSLITAAI